MNKLLMALCLMLTAGSCTISSDVDYGNSHVLLGDSQQLYDALSQTQDSCHMILSQALSSEYSNLVLGLGERGVEVKILMNVRMSNISYGEADMYFGNQSSAIQENIVIHDEQITIIGTSDGKWNFPCVNVRYVGLKQRIEGEFEQMALLHRFSKGNDVELSKQTWTTPADLNIAGNSFEVYYHPQDNALQHLYTTLLHAGGELSLVLKGCDDPALIMTLDTLQRYGRLVNVYDWQDQNPDLLKYYQGKISFLTEDPPFNVLFIQSPEQNMRVLLWTFTMESKGEMNRSDAILLDISGAFARQVYELYTARYLSSSYHQDYTVDTIYTPNVGKVIISEIGFMNCNGEWKGDFIEIANISTQAMDLSACRIIISNANRLSTPDSLSFPPGTLLLPGNCLVIASSYSEYSHVDFYSDLFLYSRGFSLTLQDKEGVILDIAGDPYQEYSHWGGRVYSGSRDKSMHRVNPRLPGYIGSNWAGSTSQTNVYPAYQKEIVATPGFYSP